MIDSRTRLKIRCRETAREIVDGLEGRSECVSCGATEAIEIHHRDGDCLNNHPINLVALCHSCHRQAHKSELVTERIHEMRSEFESLTD